MNHKLVSIIIPTYNEAEDIEKTLNACVKLNYPNKEIIVVDDSIDSTPDIVSKYAKSGVHLIKRKKNIGGRCGARNEGIMFASGEIVVVLNADVILPEHFIEDIMKHYDAGADYVLVASKVSNTEQLFARFVDASHKCHYAKKSDYQYAEWTEGFSCRREAAIAAGLFPVPPIKILAGEDGYFGNKLKEKKFKKIVDLSIIVEHYAPHTFRDFWRIRRERISAPASYFLENRSYLEILLRTVVRSIVAFAKFVFVLPIFFSAAMLSRCSPHGARDFFPFVFVYGVQEIAYLVGKWYSLFHLSKYFVSKRLTFVAW